MEEVIMHTDDALFAPSEHGCQLAKFKGHITHTVYEDKNFQVFDTPEVNGVYDKKNEKVYSLHLWNWTALVGNIGSLLENSVMRFDWLKQFDRKVNTESDDIEPQEKHWPEEDDETRYH